MSIKAMKLALNALEEINKLSIGENAICLPAEIDAAMEVLSQSIQEAETKQWIERAAPGSTVQVGTERIVVDHITGKLTTEQASSNDYRAMYLKVRDELAALQQSIKKS